MLATIRDIVVECRIFSEIVRILLYTLTGKCCMILVIQGWNLVNGACLLHLGGGIFIHDTGSTARRIS
jgi:hypothetical protein